MSVAQFAHHAGVDAFAKSFKRGQLTVNRRQLVGRERRDPFRRVGQLRSKRLCQVDKIPGCQIEVVFRLGLTATAGRFTPAALLFARGEHVGGQGIDPFAVGDVRGDNRRGRGFPCLFAKRFQLVDAERPFRGTIQARLVDEQSYAVEVLRQTEKGQCAEGVELQLLIVLGIHLQETVFQVVDLQLATGEDDGVSGAELFRHTDNRREVHAPLDQQVITLGQRPYRIDVALYVFGHLLGHLRTDRFSAFRQRVSADVGGGVLTAAKRFAGQRWVQPVVQDVFSDPVRCTALISIR
ncbi:hypothetical protein NVIRENTERO_03649 [Sodalis praecaptivus]|nr:hypothetical protein NVIRENTERO_03649 [Sodalis praecaptivus]